MTPLFGASLETRFRDAKSSSIFDFWGEERHRERIQPLEAKMVQPNLERLTWERDRTVSRGAVIREPAIIAPHGPNCARRQGARSANALAGFEIPSDRLI
jgi:hypothetical protein